MRVYILLVLAILAGCTNRQESVDYGQMLDSAQVRLDNGESLSEDIQLCKALEYYQNLEPKDSARLSQATILAAWHYWWSGRKQMAYDLLDPLAEADKESAYALLDISSKDYDYEACYRYMQIIMADKDEQHFENQQALAVLSYYTGRQDECERQFECLPYYIKTPGDSTLYWEKVLPNYADILSDYGKTDKAIELHKLVVSHFMNKDGYYVARAHASLARCHLLLGNINEAERHLKWADEYADDNFRNMLSMSSYMTLLRSILDYAKNNRINMMEWATFVNSLQENSNLNQAITEAKDESNRLLNERNLKLTIEQQRTHLIFTYVGIALVLLFFGLMLYLHRKKQQFIEKEEELESLRLLVSESQDHTEQKDDRFFKRMLLQQLGVIKMAASNPTTANQEFIRRMSEIVDRHIPVDSLLNWDDLYKTIDYIYDGFYTEVVNRYGGLLNEKEIQLCCLLKANFSTKEISVVTQQSVRTVYQRKSTIRQNLQMPEAEDIATFLSQR